MNEQLVVDDLTFEVRRSARRKTLELTLDRGGELRVAAPPNAGGERLERFVRDNLFWLYTKIAEKGTLLRPVAQRQFVRHTDQATGTAARNTADARQDVMRKGIVC